MDTYTLKIVLITAIKAEELGMKYYSRLTNKFSANPELRETFELLTLDEALHKKQFTQLLNSLSEDTKTDEELSVYFSGVNITKYFKRMEDFQNNAESTDILKFAYEFEKESVLYYLGIKDIIGSNETIDGIIRIEKHHMTKLMKHILEDSKFRGIEDGWE